MSFIRPIYEMEGNSAVVSVPPAYIPIADRCGECSVCVPITGLFGDCGVYVPISSAFVLG
jgi:hypothetical protein